MLVFLWRFECRRRPMNKVIRFHVMKLLLKSWEYLDFILIFWRTPYSWKHKRYSLEVYWIIFFSNNQSDHLMQFRQEENNDTFLADGDPLVYLTEPMHRKYSTTFVWGHSFSTYESYHRFFNPLPYLRID